MGCFLGTTKLEQQLPLQGSCSNVRAFTQCTYLGLLFASEPLSGTMLVLSSLTKVAMHICTHGGIHSGDGQQRQSILWGDSCRITFSFASHTLVNFTPIFLNRTGRLLLCFCCVYTAANKWNYLQTSWVSTEILNSGT